MFTRPWYWVHFSIAGKTYTLNAHSYIEAIRKLRYFDRTCGEITTVTFYGRMDVD